MVTKRKREELLPAVHPGEILKKDLLVEIGMSQYQLAKAIGVPQMRISQIVRGKRSITADTALRLAQFFGTSAEFWLNLQACYDLDIASEAVGRDIEETVKPYRKTG